MPYFKLKLTVKKDVLTALRDLPKRARENVSQKFVTELLPELQQQVDMFLPPLVPGTPKSPFRFGTAKSKAYYHWLVDQIDGLSDGEHWIRSGEVERGFRAFIAERFRETQFTITNVHPAAQIVYPSPRQVAGHKDTGWGDEMQAARDQLREWMNGRIIELWREAFHEALHGR